MRCLLYMILASQFNSFAQPAVIMLAEPLAVVELNCLRCGGRGIRWNTYSVIGLILLIGFGGEKCHFVGGCDQSVSREGDVGG